MRKLMLGVTMAVFALTCGQAGAAFGPLGADFRISNVGADADANRDAGAPAVAYNPAANDYLAVWEADGLATDDETEIFGQWMSVTGNELSGEFRISNIFGTGSAARDAGRAAVAYGSAANEYMVVFQGDGLATDDEDEIWGHRVTATGGEIGVDFRISNVFGDGNAAHDGLSPAIAYNPTANEFLVVWQGDGQATDDANEIFGQRVSAAGAELGTDFRISTVGDLDNDANRDGFNPAVAYNPTANEYLVTWSGDGLATVYENEIFGQRVSAAGDELGTDFRFSNVGTDGDDDREAADPAVAYDPTADEYLVTWSGDGLATEDELEIFGQRVSAAGAEVGADFRISNVGSDGDASRDATTPAVAYSSTANEYLAAWEGDGLATDEEYEIFGQRVSAAGAELGTDFRISNVGTDADAARQGFNAALAYNPVANEYVAAWEGDVLATHDETEIFCRRIE